MSEKKIDQRVIDLWDQYVHVHFDRRRFFVEAGLLLGGVGAAAALLPQFESNYAGAAVIDENDKRIAVEWLSFAGASGTLKAYQAAPKTPLKLPGKGNGILVVHQNRGLNPHIEDITRRLATEGYVALAVDFLSPLGGTPSDEDAAMQLFPKLDGNMAIADAHAAIAFIRKRGDPNGKVGALGFCWGGGIVNCVAADPAKMIGANPDASVVYYGAPPPLDWVRKIKAPILLNYADPQKDTRLGGLLPGYEKALTAAKIKYTLYTYDGANHAFNDDTQQARYNEAAAQLAWDRTLGFLKSHLA